VPKAKRKLTNIDFSSDDAHIALVHKEQGGPASGADYALVIKANAFSQDFLEKATKVKVTMDIQDFLAKFYNIYYEDSEVLARVMGFDTEREEIESYEDYIDKKVASIEIMKSLKDEKTRDVKLASLSEDDYLALLQDQSQLEQYVLKAEQTISASSDDSSNSTESKLVENEKVEPVAGSDIDNLEKSMTVTTEMVEKSQLVAVEKALADTKEALTKALADVEVYKQKEKEAVTKARFAKLVDAVKDEDKATALFKALSLVEDEAEFDATVKTLADMTAAVEKSALFEEKGASAESEAAPKESAVAKVIKARQAAAKQTKE